MSYAPYWWYDPLRFRFTFGVYPIVEGWISERVVFSSAGDYIPHCIPGSTTLDQADELAEEIYHMISELWSTAKDNNK
jgi:hypothetical protein